MIKELIKIANLLDYMGLKVEADGIDGMIRRIASSGDSGHKEFGSGDYGIYHMAQVDGGFYAISWFDTLEEAERELASGHYQIDGGGYPYIVTREKKMAEMPRPNFLPPDEEDGHTILSEEDISKLTSDILQYMVHAEQYDEDTRRDIEVEIWDALHMGTPLTVERLKNVAGSEERRYWGDLNNRFSY